MVLFITILFCGCKSQQTKPIEDNSEKDIVSPVEKETEECMPYQTESATEECMPCKISRKCIALLAYGLLSDDKFDIPFGGTCTEIASESLVNFLVCQKSLFKKYKDTGKINARELIRQILRIKHKNVYHAICLIALHSYHIGYCRKRISTFILRGFAKMLYPLS